MRFQTMIYKMHEILQTCPNTHIYCFIYRERESERHDMEEEETATYKHTKVIYWCCIRTAEEFVGESSWAFSKRILVVLLAVVSIG